MLTASQQDFFAENGYLVVEDVFDHAAVMEPVRAEYSRLLDDLVLDGRDAERSCAAIRLRYVYPP